MATPRSILGPAKVRTDSLQPNPHNPRLLFDKLPLKTLEESIRRVGILVPIVVFRASGSDKYTILDGQRRWMCARNIGLREVPINEVGEPSVAQNIVTMFQIHKLRLDWELMPTALKLQVLMNELDERRDRQLAELTGLDVAVVVRCKKLLSFSTAWQEKMLYARPEDRIKADFFIELHPIINDRTVKKSKLLKTSELIETFVDKYEHRKSGIKSVTDFRKIKQSLTAARASDHEAEVLKKFEEYVSSDRKEIEYLDINLAKIHKEASKLTKMVDLLSETLTNLEVDNYAGEEELWVSLEKLEKTLARTLGLADRRIK
ncbi:ParB/RepB/Spo0J family partition protein [Aestuariivirga sp.]|uniref:ParB/RepB/Spo0J family partition protein n=1 Tax=Aestuariivirga sp. TaxID=2650926 RepID=UPI0039E24D60